MKELVHRLLFTAAVMTAGVLYADAVTEYRLGDEAFYAGDYRNAIGSYELVLRSADRTKDTELWRSAALNLITAYLHDQKSSEALQLLAEFSRRYPAYPVDVLRGEALAAGGQYAEAEKVLLTAATCDNHSEDARLFSLAVLYMKTGRMSEACELFLRVSGRTGELCVPSALTEAGEALRSGRAAEAYRLTGRLIARPDSPWKFYASAEAGYALIRLGRKSEAATVLAEIPADKRNINVELLQYLLEAVNGKYQNLKKNQSIFVEKIPVQLHPRAVELFSRAAEAAAEARDHEFAAAAWRQAMSFVSVPSDRRELHRQLIDTLAAAGGTGVVEEARNYWRSYPDDPQRVDELFDTAADLYRLKSYTASFELFTFLQEQKLPEAKSLEAIAGAIACAEMTRDFSQLEKLNRQIFERTGTSDRLLWQSRYAAYLEKNGKYELAGKELLSAREYAGLSGRSRDLEKSSMLLLEFYIRRGDAARIREYAQMLEKSTVPEYKAGAKLALGDLLADSFVYARARQYYQESEDTGSEKYAGMASFKKALMSYRNNDFRRAANEFFSSAVKYPGYEKAPEALFMAVDLFDPVNDAEMSAKAADILRTVYPGSEAFAVLVLRQAADGAMKGDFVPVIRDLQLVEKNFSGTKYAGEAALMHAVFLDKTGDSAGARRILSGMFRSPDKSLAAESMMRSAEICFRQGDFSGARHLFLQSAAVQPYSYQSDIALIRAGDCELAGKSPLDTAVVAGAAERFEKLSSVSKFDQIRLEAAVKNGIALEHAGDNVKALAAYEKAIYIAVDMNSRGVLPESLWCIRSCESALRLLVSSGENGSLQRGLRLLERCEKLLLNDDFTGKARDNFRKQMLKQRR